jgi:hypothetical protein
MECLVIFGAENAHPLAWLLNRQHRHVWCALRDTERGAWVSYNWHQGAPIIRVEAAADYDLAAHYRGQGYTVVPVARGVGAVLYPLILNNCVGHVKLICGIRSWSVTPNQLHAKLTRKQGRLMQLKTLLTLPGFGGGTPCAAASAASAASAPDEGGPRRRQVARGRAASPENAARYGRHNQDRVGPAGRCPDGQQNPFG